MKRSNRSTAHRGAAISSWIAMWVGIVLNNACRADEHTFHRAGHPECIAPWAAPSNTPRYSGDYVGGGCAFGGRGRTRDEGTWGWDYHRSVLSHRPWLDWCCGRRLQARPGTYETDGPRTPDPLGKLRF